MGEEKSYSIAVRPRLIKEKKKKFGIVILHSSMVTTVFYFLNVHDIVPKIK